MCSSGYYRILEADLEKFVSTLKGTIAADCESSARNYIDHNEFGLAFEDICFYFRDVKKKIPSDCRELFRELAERMGIDRKYWIPLIENDA